MILSFWFHLFFIIYIYTFFIISLLNLKKNWFSFWQLLVFLIFYVYLYFSLYFSFRILIFYMAFTFLILFAKLIFYSTYIEIIYVLNYLTLCIHTNSLFFYFCFSLYFRWFFHFLLSKFYCFTSHFNKLYYIESSSCYLNDFFIINITFCF